MKLRSALILEDVLNTKVKLVDECTRALLEKAGIKTTNNPSDVDIRSISSQLAERGYRLVHTAEIHSHNDRVILSRGGAFIAGYEIVIVKERHTFTVRVDELRKVKVRTKTKKHRNYK